MRALVRERVQPVEHVARVRRAVRPRVRSLALDNVVLESPFEHRPVDPHVAPLAVVLLTILELGLAAPAVPPFGAAIALVRRDDERGEARLQRERAPLHLSRRTQL